ncbi:Fe-S protein assembly co-chaperone HscB [Cryptosporidium meleagridis]|uniref:Fe-S protein assembly co-chaperone HscB n=1 Tax=Cryptosporidium meleagridis TaxID=93969 RepID=A0A2P4Z2R6_9CRYT|nr:Fe-S protein assembly co-chaperone HscB [Cryptosporidium meleagridis]
MIFNICNEKLSALGLISKLTLNYKISVSYFKQFPSSYLLLNSNFKTNQCLRDKSKYSDIKKTFKHLNEENLSGILNMNAFQLFGLENKFSINKKSVDLSYKELMRKLHPDVSNNVNESISIHIIKQYNTLNDPFERALLLISLKSNITRDNLINIMDTIPVSSSLLEQIFEIDDKLMEISNSSFNITDIDEISKKNKFKIDSCIKSLEKEFENDSFSIAKILSILKELRIYQKLSERASSILDN